MLMQFSENSPDHDSGSGHELDFIRLRGHLPDSPGVYSFKDGSGRVIYVGKAKSLKKRVLSYFRPPKELPRKTAVMIEKARALDFVVTSTENEAFILESNLIKKHMPRYNVILRDDKQYPCLRLDIKEPYPRLAIVRRIKKDGALYFGPFSSSLAVRNTLNIIDRVFQLRKCKGKGPPKRTRACLNYQMGRCLGPCTFDIPVSSYQEIVHKVRLFLEDRSRELVTRLTKDMMRASEELDFEKAATIRDQISAIEKTVEHQDVVSPRMEDLDIIGMARSGAFHQVVILFVRKGYMIGSRYYGLENRGGSKAEAVEAFIKQYYPRETFIPKKILIPDPIEDLNSISEWLSDLAGKRVTIHRPMRGEKLRLVGMAVKNAEKLLEGRSKVAERDIMEAVQSALNLKSPPRFIEGLDISNFHGELAVGTVVSFVDGQPHKGGYRNYRIKATVGIDDYGMMAELAKRRMQRGGLPDLILVDGGKGHLSVVKAALDLYVESDSPALAAIAKPDENRGESSDKLYVPGRKNPLKIRADDPVLLLMMRIRDEAHRRAITYHRRLRSKELTSSELSLIPGVGKKRQKLLLGHFKDVKAVAGAGMDDLLKVPGISQSIASNIVSYFQGSKNTS
jgi:excinuclease ABC subunit C